MSECDLLADCPFFNDKMIDRGQTELFKQQYCNDDYVNCARYMIANKLGRKAMPEELYPNMQYIAREVIDRITKSREDS